MLIGDWTSNRWVTFFSDIGEKTLNAKTDELAQLMQEDKTEFDSRIQDVLFKPRPFKFRAKVETYGVSLINFYF